MEFHFKKNTDIFKSQNVASEQSKPRRMVIRVPEMDCPNESRVIDSVLQGIPGAAAEYDYLQRTASVSMPQGGPGAEELAGLIRAAGLGAEPAKDMDTGDNIGVRRMVIRVPEMDCPNESRVIDSVLRGIPGAAAEYDYLQRTASVSMPHGGPGAEELAGLIRAAGLGAEPADGVEAFVCPVCGRCGCCEHERNAVSDGHKTSALRRRADIWCALSGAALLLGMCAALIGQNAASMIMLCSSAMLGAAPLLPRALRSLRAIRPDMNLLMIIAVTGALFLGEYLEAAAVAFLFRVSSMLESWSAGHARSSIEKLLDITPENALIADAAAHGGYRSVPVRTVPVGSRLLVRPGDRVPVDGIVREGNGFVDESPVTGESSPSEKHPGDPLFAGSVNADAALVMESTALYKDSTVARIVKLVGEARENRAESERWVDRFAAVYTPLMMALALLVAVVPLFWGRPFAKNVYDALVLLVISCPCALVISTPAAVASAMARAARNGVLLKGGTYLEIPAQADVVFFDKTGTLTTGDFTVAGIGSFCGMEAGDVLACCASLEAYNTHPIARAVVRESEARALSLPAAADVLNVPGRGAEGVIGGERCMIGSRRWLEEYVRDDAAQGFAFPQDGIPDESSRTLWLWSETRLIGCVRIADTPKPEAKETIEMLRSIKAGEPVMLTGDSPENAAPLAESLGIAEFRASLLPQDKTDHVDNAVKSGKTVLMAGDGINDAPALAAATMGIAVGSAADVAFESADCILARDDLRLVPWLVGLSRRTRGIVRFNIAAALGIKATVFILAACGSATMWMAVAADVGTTVAVTLNSLRLLRN